LIWDALPFLRSCKRKLPKCIPKQLTEEELDEEEREEKENAKPENNSVFDTVKNFVWQSASETA
jgi:hypothetical protein